MLITINAALAGFFACAAIHCAVHWWLSRNERVLLVFAIQCAVYTVFCFAISAFFRATTIAAAQTSLDRFMTIAMFCHALMLQFYAALSGRRDHAFRALVTVTLAFLVVSNQWFPLRGAVVALRTMPLPWGGMGLVAIRTGSPNAALAVLYLLVLAIQSYGLFVARTIWKRDRVGAVLIGFGAAAILGAVATGFVVDFAHVRAPYLGALPHAINVLFVAFFLAREYSSRGARVVATETKVEVAERANRTKSELLAHVSHEIRNPLQIIMGNAQLLERDVTLGAAQHRKTVSIRTTANHLSTLVNNLLEMAKIDARYAEVVEERFDLVTMFDDVERMFGEAASSKRIALEIDCAPNLRSLFGDGAKVKRILINLVSNALKFTEHGSIRLTASARPSAEEGSVVKVVVADTGIGIAPDDVGRIFERFEQLNAGKHAGGTGLGLAISLEHARLMGGDLTVESTLGRGSAFTLTFEAKRATPMVLPTVAVGAARLKALIVDDVAVNRDVLSELLSEAGVETRTADDGPNAIPIEREWRPDLVLVDLRMPVMDGLELIRQLRAAGSSAAIGALSASALADDERRSLALGADFFLGKPYDDRDLMDKIARTFGTRQVKKYDDGSPSTRDAYL